MTATTATWACAIACAVLVAAEWRRSRGLVVAAKLAASAAFLVVAARTSGGHAFAAWMIAGLALGAAGDGFLLGRGRPMFLGGLVAFLLGHFAYVAGLAQLVGPGQWPAAAGAYAALPDPQRTRLCAGAALFFVSDLAVARDRFVAPGFPNRLWGLPAYYAGQLLIAWSIG